MEKGCRIADAMNTYNLALSIVKSKGYKIFVLPHADEENFDFWAIKGTRQFAGGDPLRLLGLVSIWENTGDDWQKHMPEEDIYDQILSRSFPDSVEDFDQLTKEDFNQLVIDYKIFFHEILDKKFPEDPTRQEMFDLIDSFYKE